MGTQAEKAPCKKTTFPAEMVHSYQGNVSAPQFYQVFLCHACYYIPVP